MGAVISPAFKNASCIAILQPPLFESLTRNQYAAGNHAAYQVSNVMKPFNHNDSQASPLSSMAVELVPMLHNISLLV